MFYVIKCFQGNSDLTWFDSQFLLSPTGLGDKINWESTYVTKFQTEINGHLSHFVTDCSHDNKIIYDDRNNDNNNNNIFIIFLSKYFPDSDWPKAHA